eukprot:TRINITY_DN2896_c0_g1_i1.p1 TRINITY_DN2896_c0_g1~~TRINITY_DN2896_c0_g1_i1.p1  ORF type:complete len:295 (+),score=102.57 TRINITY_DN2896_c0_g1_i1:48-932(+)
MVLLMYQEMGLSRALVVLCLLAVFSSASELSPVVASVEQEGKDLMNRLQATCGASGYDLSGLTKTSGKDYSYATSDGHYTWYINVCSNTIQPCQGDQKPSPGVWNYDYSQPYACFNLADSSTATWSKISNGIAVKYTGGDACYNVNPPSTYSLQIDFTCDASNPGALSKVETGASACDFKATFPTSKACGGGSGSGGSGSTGAWVFNILVLAGFPLYFLIGFIYNWKARGLEGTEAIPHVEFWKDLPRLVLDGILYTWSLIRGLFVKCGLCKDSGDSYPSSSSSGSSAGGYGAI